MVLDVDLDWEDFLMYIKKSSQEDLALKSKLRPAKFFNTALYMLATRVLPASLNFGQAKHNQNGPAATVWHTYLENYGTQL